METLVYPWRTLATRLPDNSSAVLREPEWIARTLWRRIPACVCDDHAALKAAP